MPKAVMLSHDNYTYTAEACRKSMGVKEGEERIVSYLPLSHVAAQVMDIVIGIYLGATITIADPQALKGTIVKTLKKARPTIFFSVPRVWEKMEIALKKVGARGSAVQKMIGAWAKSVGKQGTTNEVLNSSTSFSI
jgi:long-chain-fatty-acid--CoA ligase ACSBG